MKITKQYIKKLIKEELKESTLPGSEPAPAPAKVNPVDTIKRLAQQIIKMSRPVGGEVTGQGKGQGTVTAKLAQQILKLTNNIIEKPAKEKGMMDFGDMPDASGY